MTPPPTPTAPALRGQYTPPADIVTPHLRHSFFEGAKAGESGQMITDCPFGHIPHELLHREAWLVGFGQGCMNCNLPILENPNGDYPMPWEQKQGELIMDRVKELALYGQAAKNYIQSLVTVSYKANADGDVDTAVIAWDAQQAIREGIVEQLAQLTGAGGGESVITNGAPQEVKCQKCGNVFAPDIIDSWTCPECGSDCKAGVSP